jgi:hypothetical protein
MQSFHDLGITQLGAVIFHLKEKGYRFKKTRHHGTNRDGMPTYWDDYYFDEGNPETPELF